ncbi:MAG: substrate-binding domain-containing protein [Dorea sp.]
MKPSGKKKRTGIAWIVLVMLCCALIGCTSQEEEKKDEEPYTIGVVTKSSDSEYWMTVNSGMEDAAKELGVSVQIVSPDEETNMAMQEKLIRDFIRKGVDVLAVSPLQSYEADYLEEARKQGIPVVAYDTRIVAEGVPYIGIDNEKAGEELAARMAELLSGTGQVGIVTGDLNQESHAKRMEGIRSYLEQNTEIQVVFVESGYSNLLMSEEKISGLLSSYPELDGIFVTSAVTALGLRDYLQDDSIRIMTVDAQQDALDAVEQGRIAALAAQSGYEIGYETIRYIVSQREEDLTQAEDKILDAKILTADNVKQWEEEN